MSGGNRTTFRQQMARKTLERMRGRGGSKLHSHLGIANPWSSKEVEGWSQHLDFLTREEDEADTAASRHQSARERLLERVGAVSDARWTPGASLGRRAASRRPSTAFRGLTDSYFVLPEWMPAVSQVVDEAEPEEEIIAPDGSVLRVPQSIARQVRRAISAAGRRRRARPSGSPKMRPLEHVGSRVSSPAASPEEQVVRRALVASGVRRDADIVTREVASAQPTERRKAARRVLRSLRSPAARSAQRELRSDVESRGHALSTVRDRGMAPTARTRSLRPVLRNSPTFVALSAPREAIASELEQMPPAPLQAAPRALQPAPRAEKTRVAAPVREARSQRVASRAGPVEPSRNIRTASELRVIASRPTGRAADRAASIENVVHMPEARGLRSISAKQVTPTRRIAARFVAVDSDRRLAASPTGYLQQTSLPAERVAPRRVSLPRDAEAVGTRAAARLETAAPPRQVGRRRSMPSMEREVFLAAPAARGAQEESAEEVAAAPAPPAVRARTARPARPQTARQVPAARARFTPMRTSPSVTPTERVVARAATVARVDSRGASVISPAVASHARPAVARRAARLELSRPTAVRTESRATSSSTWRAAVRSDGGARPTARGYRHVSLPPMAHLTAPAAVSTVASEEAEPVASSAGGVQRQPRSNSVVRTARAPRTSPALSASASGLGVALAPSRDVVEPTISRTLRRPLARVDARAQAAEESLRSVLPTRPAVRAEAVSSPIVGLPAARRIDSRMTPVAVSRMVERSVAPAGRLDRLGSARPSDSASRRDVGNRGNDVPDRIGVGERALQRTTAPSLRAALRDDRSAPSQRRIGLAIAPMRHLSVESGEPATVTPEQPDGPRPVAVQGTEARGARKYTSRRVARTRQDLRAATPATVAGSPSVVADSPAARIGVARRAAPAVPTLRASRRAEVPRRTDVRGRELVSYDVVASAKASSIERLTARAAEPSASAPSAPRVMRRPPTSPRTSLLQPTAPVAGETVESSDEAQPMRAAPARVAPVRRAELRELAATREPGQSVPRPTSYVRPAVATSSVTERTSALAAPAALLAPSEVHETSVARATVRAAARADEILSVDGTGRATLSGRAIDSAATRRQGRAERLSASPVRTPLERSLERPTPGATLEVRSSLDPTVPQPRRMRRSMPRMEQATLLAAKESPPAVEAAVSSDEAAVKTSARSETRSREVRAPRLRSAPDVARTQRAKVRPVERAAERSHATVRGSVQGLPMARAGSRPAPAGRPVRPGAASYASSRVVHLLPVVGQQSPDTSVESVTGEERTSVAKRVQSRAARSIAVDAPRTRLSERIERQGRSATSPVAHTAVLRDATLLHASRPVSEAEVAAGGAEQERRSTPSLRAERRERDAVAVIPGVRRRLERADDVGHPVGRYMARRAPAPSMRVLEPVAATVDEPVAEQAVSTVERRADARTPHSARERRLLPTARLEERGHDPVSVIPAARRAVRIPADKERLPGRFATARVLKTTPTASGMRVLVIQPEEPAESAAPHIEARAAMEGGPSALARAARGTVGNTNSSVGRASARATVLLPTVMEALRRRAEMEPEARLTEQAAPGSRLVGRSVTSSRRARSTVGRDVGGRFVTTVPGASALGAQRGPARSARRFGFGSPRLTTLSVDPGLEASERLDAEVAPAVTQARYDRSLGQTLMGLEAGREGRGRGVPETSQPGARLPSRLRPSRRSADGAQRRQVSAGLPTPELLRSVTAGPRAEDGAPQGESGDAPSWATRAATGSGVKSRRGGLRDEHIEGREVRGLAMQTRSASLVQALARASKPAEVVELLLDREENRRLLSNVLPAGAASLVDRLIEVETTRRVEQQVAERQKLVSPVRTAFLSRPYQRKSAKQQQQSASATEARVSALAGKLMSLIHLAENERRLREAQSQVRMSTVAPDEGSPAGEASGDGENVNLETLQREVLSWVMRELELQKVRGEGDDDVYDQWW